ncbi:MAG: TetR/AcrR family transcriptional regulator [Actinobacteria bacterium]|nr:TetR/AcrR family transcriptional regulator [Actinomycetota bacterium]MBV8958067.1 TetR/AcrR family transcriptional regulator [Actinomycetota bacterium]MBV9254450.1 TetR/AcrR family transcriptional regulator [Actinomycetota bacterium]MBV9664836.1 TetR/AcrR family transcriptional regulator [Actinomycetota bacterium]MBV9936449.1 TetR/AcrR family transcriptional regulator [Actinomycetota bacterium]
MADTATTAGRRTQADRRAETQRRLLDATVEELSAHGYAGMSTNEVIKRAGVSRGALVHHFPTKAQLAVAALDRWLEDRLVEFEATFAALRPEERTAEVAIDVLWEMFSGPSFAAWLELTVAARTDGDLWTRLTVVNDRFNEGVAATVRRTFGIDEATPSDGPDPIVFFAFNVLSGAALGQVLAAPPGSPRPAETPEGVAILKSLAQMFANDSWRNA